MLACKITLPDSPHPVFISKNPGFRALFLARQNEFRFFRLTNTKLFLFSFLAVGFCPKNLAFARKIMALPESGGPQTSWLVRLCVQAGPKSKLVYCSNNFVCGTVPGRYFYGWEKEMYVGLWTEHISLFIHIRATFLCTDCNVWCEWQCWDVTL